MNQEDRDEIKEIASIATMAVFWTNLKIVGFIIIVPPLILLFLAGVLTAIGY